MCMYSFFLVKVISIVKAFRRISTEMAKIDDIL